MIKCFGTVYRLHPLFILLMILSVITGSFIELFTLFGIVLIHELGHVAAGKSFGWRIPEVRLLPFGGVAITDEGGSVPAREEMLVALAGPLQNVVLAGFGLLMLAAGAGSGEWWVYFIRANLSIAFFNLLPIHPLDGGRVLLCLLSYRLSYHQTLVVVTRISFALSLLLLAASVVPQLSSGINLNLIVLALFLAYSNYYSHRHLPFHFLRFLTGREMSTRRFLQEGANLQRVYVDGGQKLSQVVQLMMRERYHLVYIYGPEGKVARIVPEQALVRAYLSGEKTDRAVSEVFL